MLIEHDDAAWSLEQVMRGHEPSKVTLWARARSEIRRAVAEVSAQIRLADEGGDVDIGRSIGIMIQLYQLRDAGKGYSSLVNTLWSALENGLGTDADGLRAVRDALERLHAMPGMAYDDARVIRRRLVDSGLDVSNSEAREIIGPIVDGAASDK